MGHKQDNTVSASRVWGEQVWVSGAVVADFYPLSDPLIFPLLLIEGDLSEVSSGGFVSCSDMGVTLLSNAVRERLR